MESHGRIVAELGSKSTVTGNRCLAEARVRIAANFALPICLQFMHYGYMAKTSNLLRKKRGHTATRRNPVILIRLPPKLKSKVAAWAKWQSDKPSLAVAIDRLLEKALAGAIASRQPRKGAAGKATEMAAREIDRLLGDQPATGEERASRKRRLLSGPKEFRDMRRRM